MRIPAEVARSARFTAGLPVELSVEESGLVVRAAGVPRLSLGQKLERFDPSVHGGEVTAAAAAGQERF